MSFVERTGDKNSPEHREPALGEVVAAIDQADIRLRMAYSHYIERPTAARMRNLTEDTEDLVGVFGNFVRAIVHSSTEPLPEHESFEEMAAIIATALCDITEQHSTVLADYSKDIVLPTEQEKKDALVGLTELLEDDAMESPAQLIDGAFARLKGVLESDMEVIEIVTAKKLWFRQQLAKEALSSVGTIAKISAGVVIGTIIADKLRRK